MRWAWAAVAAVAASCSRPAAEPAPTAEAPKEKPPVELATGPVELEVRDESGKTAFVVRARASEIAMESSGAKSGLKEVSGDIFQGGKVASRFKAARGEVDQKARTLLAEGKAELRDTARGLVLRADRVRYRESEARVVAEGGVTVSSEEWQIGPFDRLVATPDLSRVGTPDRFR